MGVFLILVGVGAILLINYVIAEKFESIAEEKGYGEEIHSFAMCFWLGIIGYLYVIALPNRTQIQNQEKLISLLSNTTSTDA